MKTIKTIAVLVLCLGLLFGSTSCFVRVKHDNGKHKGWHKNSNNPHNENSSNTQKSHGNSGKNK